jgi:IS5 family transposase
MRKKVHEQRRLVVQGIEHEHAKELETISELLDKHPEVYDLVHADLVAGGIDPDKGRQGMSAEQVLRILIIKQMNGFSYKELAFHLEDSNTYQRFCRIGMGDQVRTDKTLQRNLKRVTAESLEAANRLLLDSAAEAGIEKGQMVRVDCTVEETNIHEPKDSELLYDVVRVLDRLMEEAKEVGFPIEFVNHTRRAKRRNLSAFNAKNDKQRRKVYRDLLKVTFETLEYATRALPVLKQNHPGLDAMDISLGDTIAEELKHYRQLGRRVVDQTRRRVLEGEKVPVADKVVSIFEPHTDIIIKDRRETLFGHKLCLTTGKSGLITDCAVLDGNPADSTLAVDAIKRQVDIYGRPPRQASFDGGFASKDNLATIKGELGVKNVVFNKRRGLKVSDMAQSTWLYKKLCRFRAGIEGGISFLKRCFGLDRCLWRGLASFKAYTWASVLSANLLMLARHMMA